MTIMERKRGGALDDLPHVEAQEVKYPEPRPERKPKPPGAKIKASLFLESRAHAHITEICDRQHISQQMFFTAAIDVYLRALGEKTIKEIEEGL